jgi:hypothetical protein
VQDCESNPKISRVQLGNASPVVSLDLFLINDAEIGAGLSQITD